MLKKDTITKRIEELENDIKGYNKELKNNHSNAVENMKWTAKHLIGKLTKELNNL